MTPTPVVSIIVPVYNAEKYLHRCIDSILAQTFINWELLLIDDGSMDASSSICDEYATKDERIRVFHKENGGVTSARKCGLEKAKGSWIGFVDADDEISPSYYNDLYKAGQVEGCSLVCATSENGRITRKDFIRGLLLNRIDWGLPSKLYKRSAFCFSDVFSIPKEISIGEDLIGNLFFSQNIDSVQLVCSNGYYYRESEMSVTHTRNWSIDYETLFLYWVEKALGNNREQFRTELYHLHVQTWKNLICNGAIVDENVEWIRNLKNNKSDVPKSLSSRILLNSPGQRCTYILLKILALSRRVLKIRG